MTVREWNAAKRKLKAEYQRRGVTCCQLCGSHSGGPLGLSWAHRKKRRYITTKEELSIVALLCVWPCHEGLEHGPKQVMYDTITRLHNQVFLREPSS